MTTDDIAATATAAARRVIVGRLRSLALALAGTVLLIPLMTAPTAARGPDPNRLAAAGWDCFGHASEAIHCLPDLGAVVTGEAVTSPILTWGTAADEFWGTELLVREDVYNGQPCPQDDVDGAPTTYIPLADLGLPLPYLVCHHFESPLT